MISATSFFVPETLFLLAATFVVYYVTSAVYCIFFHPLSKYPGPFLAKFSGIPSFYHTYQGDRHIWLWQCHEIYGDVVRASYDTLLFSDPEAYRTIYGSQANVHKAWQFMVWPKDKTAVSTFACMDKPTHKRRRRNLEYAFSDRAVRASEPYIIEHSDRWGPLLVEGTEKEWSEPRNMTQWTDSYIFDIFCDLCFGWTYETKKPGTNKLRTVPHDIAQYMQFTYIIFYSPIVSIWLFMKPRGLDKLFSKMIPPSIQFFMDFVAEGLGKRIDQENANKKAGVVSERQDMLHFLINAEDVDTGKPAYDFIDLCEEANMLTAAGSDTTSAVMAALFFYLIHDPKALKKLQVEIRSTFKSLEDIKTGKELSSCQYLNACIDETLRMNPHGGSESRREVMPGGIKIGNDDIPAGTIIGGDVFAIHHKAEIYYDPFRFRPERWIVSDDVSEEDVKACEGAAFAFSYGVRACPGKSMARMELAISFARCIFQYDFRGLPGNTEGQGSADLIWGRRQKTQYQVKDFMVSYRDGPMVQFKKRSNELI